MTHPTAVILVVGLNESLIGDHTPSLQAFASGGATSQLKPVLPAVTCSVQASMLTGQTPGSSNGHGIVGNGFYDRTLAEIQFWKQSNHLVKGEKVWETAKRRDPLVTCANLFWWFNMYSSVDYSVTPRPLYKANGRKFPDIYTEPSNLRHQLQDKFGTFPLFNFWGPAASIVASQWISDATMYVYEQHRPTLTLSYLPHLDYALQKLGPNHSDITIALKQIDGVVGRLIEFFQQNGVRVMIVSEYGIEPVDEAVAINLVLRQAGFLRTREEQGLELLDPGASTAFAVADHQVAHVYVKDPSVLPQIASLCQQTPGVEQVLNDEDQVQYGLDHRRSGDLILVASPGWWFCYRYWMEDQMAPDFARTVDIHRKPGYDPLELFIDPTIRFPTMKLGWKWLKTKMGQRTTFDVIPLETKLVKGSHGRIDQDRLHAPVLISQTHTPPTTTPLPCQAVHDSILQHLFD